MEWERAPAIEVDAQVTLYAARDSWKLLDPAALDGPALEADASLGSPSNRFSAVPLVL